MPYSISLSHLMQGDLLDLLHNLKMKEELLGKMMLSTAAYSSI
ncbi:hypothetical protein Sarmat_01112 [Rickettsiales endosymbiont of Paramecium tredecaurelia]|nr:hypothetical protein [Candidatus Sarmatiella mevalonica]